MAGAGPLAAGPPQPARAEPAPPMSKSVGRVARAAEALGLSVEIRSIDNPRKEREEHYYNPTHSGLIELGLKPHYMTDDVVAAMLERILANKGRIDPARIMPRVRWS